jgi:CheY-like chemotaxis protein
MSHELRTPLNGVIGFTQVLHDGMVGPVSDAQRELTGDVLNSARHLLKLINDILDLAKVEAGKLDAHPEPVDVRALAGEVLDGLRPLWSAKRLRVDVDVHGTIGPVVQDPSRIKQVLYNYFSNAIKFTPDGGTVTVQIAPEDDGNFRIEVRDTGIGIAPGDVGRLFTEFQQLDGGASKRFQGAGLGLAVTRRIAEMLGGSVGVRSEPGHGSTFHAVLPRRLARSHGAAVLVIDHDARDRHQIERVLAAAGYDTDSVARGRDAVRRCAERDYAAIVMDVLLEDMPGSGVLQVIRGGRNGATPVVVASVVADLAPVEGARLMLVKPFRDAELLAALRQCGVPAPVEQA